MLSEILSLVEFVAMVLTGYTSVPTINMKQALYAMAREKSTHKPVMHAYRSTPVLLILAALVAWTQNVMLVFKVTICRKAS